MIVILLCTACKQRYTQFYGKLRKCQTAERRKNKVRENELPGILFEEIGGIYEVIDELNMIDNLDIRRGSRE